jgi:hypothetical protein
MKRCIGFKTFFSVLVAITLFVAVGADASAYSVKQKLFGFGAVAGEALATGDVVCIKDADGLAYKADADAVALRPAVGIIGLGAAAAGDPVEIITHGILRGWASLSEGQNAYLSTMAGAVTQSAPAYAQKIGFAVSATEYLFSFQEYLDTSALSVLGVLTGATPLIFEGATADAYETTISVTDPTADRTITIPNRAGQVQLASAAGVLTPGGAVTLTVGLSNLYTLAINDNEDTTITFSGAGTAGDEITIVIATGAGTTGDEVVTFHATLVSSTGILTCANTASRFYVIRFISDGSHWYEVSRTAIQT